MHDLQRQDETTAILPFGGPGPKARPSITIRAAREVDSRAIAAILAQAGDPISTLAFGRQVAVALETLTRYDVREASATTLVATIGERVVGVAVVVGRARPGEARKTALRRAVGRPRTAWAALVLRAASHVGLDQGEAYFESLAVAPEWRRAGVARALFERGLVGARNGGALTLTFWVNTRNVNARSFFDAAGLEPIREVRRIPLPGPPWRVLMCRFHIVLADEAGHGGLNGALPRQNG